MAEFPALPIWTDAYLADCSHLTDAEHGIYLQLLMLMWRSPDCRIPNDDEWIARKFRRDANAVRTHIRPLMQEFCDIGVSWITQKRLQKEWKWCSEKREKNKASANTRWNKDSDSCERISKRISKRNAPTPITTPIYKKDDFNDLSKEESDKLRAKNLAWKRSKGINTSSTSPSDMKWLEQYEKKNGVISSSATPLQPLAHG